MTIAITRRDWWAGILVLTAGILVLAWTIWSSQADEHAMLRWLLGQGQPPSL